MSKILKGKDVIDNLNEHLIRQTNELRDRGICPTLGILRVGERPDDLSYEKGAIKRCESVGVEAKVFRLPHDVSEDVYLSELNKLNQDKFINGILIFRPLPRHINEDKARNIINPSKDVDGCTDLSLAGVFTNTSLGFSPCTAEAVIAMLKYYDIKLSGKRVTVIGRSLVIGRPVAMLLMHENATVTICHTKTKDLKFTVKEADIVIAASGQMESIDASYLKPEHVVIDVGINWNEDKQRLCGDVCFDEAKDIVAAISPVPGGVGGVTTCILAKHVIEAAIRQNIE